MKKKSAKRNWKSSRLLYKYYLLQSLTLSFTLAYHTTRSPSPFFILKTGKITTHLLQTRHDFFFSLLTKSVFFGCKSLMQCLASIRSFTHLVSFKEISKLLQPNFSLSVSWMFKKLPTSLCVFFLYCCPPSKVQLNFPSSHSQIAYFNFWPAVIISIWNSSLH